MIEEVPLAILDKEADAFARCLLMPEKQVLKWWPIVLGGTHPRPVQRMATLFAVETEQMSIRLAELDLI